MSDDYMGNQLIISKIYEDFGNVQLYSLSYNNKNKQINNSKQKTTNERIIKQ